MNKWSILIITALLLGVVNLYLTTTKTDIEKVGFVRTQEVLEGYEGAKDAIESYQQKMHMWQSKLDSLEKEYEIMQSKYNVMLKAESVVSKQEVIRLEFFNKTNQLNIERENITREQEKVDNFLSKGVVNQITSAVSKYGKENGYSIIFSSDNGEVVLYGNEGKDLTQKIIDLLNQDY